MKKFLIFLSFIIFIMNPFSVKASSGVGSIELSSGTLNLLSSGSEELLIAVARYMGFSPSSNDSDDLIYTFSELNPNIDYANISDFSESYTINELSSIDRDFLSSYNLYNSLGQSISSDNVYVGKADNGFFTSTFYCDSSGNLIYADSTLNDPIADLRLGGIADPIHSYGEWISNYHDVYDYINENSMAYSSEGVNASSISAFCVCGTCGGGLKSYGVFYCGNVYQPNVIVPNSNYTNSICNVYYCNDLSVCNIKNYGSNTSLSYGIVHVDEGTYRQGGYTYRYEITTCPYDCIADWGTDISLGSFLSLDPDNDFGFYRMDVKLPFYNSSLDNVRTKAVRTFYPLTYNRTKEWDYSKATTLSDISALCTDTTIDGVINPSYDDDEPVSAFNFPVSFPIDVPISIGVSSIPDSITSDPDIPIDPDIPSDEDVPSIGTVPDITLPFNIPFLSNLQNRFPFSIPFDIYRLYSGLSVQRQAPKFNFTIHIPKINYDWNVNIDLTSWEVNAEIFRTCFLILFIIGLAVFCYRHFFGS